jgi:ABC-type molybdate transport system substrate-binding protein
MNLRLVGCLVAIGMMIAPANAAELKVLATGAQTAVFKELIPQFEQATGHKVSWPITRRLPR